MDVGDGDSDDEGDVVGVGFVNDESAGAIAGISVGIGVGVGVGVGVGAGVGIDMWFVIENGHGRD
jgi:hypothetical protein